jgi:hypothetical protein
MERARQRSRRRAISAMWWMNSRFWSARTVANGSSGSDPVGVLAEPGRVQLLGTHRRDAVVPAVPVEDLLDPLGAHAPVGGDLVGRHAATDLPVDLGVLGRWDIRGAAVEHPRSQAEGLGRRRLAAAPDRPGAGSHRYSSSPSPVSRTWAISRARSSWSTSRLERSVRRFSMGVPFAVTHRLRPWRVGVCCHVQPMRSGGGDGSLAATHRRRRHQRQIRRRSARYVHGPEP